MKKLPAYTAPFLFGGLLSLIMVAIVSAVVLLVNQGITDAYLGNWLKSFVTTWPIAFPTVLVVAPLVRRLVGQLVQPT